MKIWVYALCWNESRILPLMIEYWRGFADHAVVYDNGSTDNSLEIIRKAAPFVELRTFGNMREFNDRHNRDCLNACWKECAGNGVDFVWCCDMDEAPYAPGGDVRAFCERMLRRGETIAQPQGLQMVSPAFPDPGRPILDQVALAARDNYFNKCDLFSPKAIRDINYDAGHHHCRPSGNVAYATEKLFLLHFKNLSWEYIRSRSSDEGKRLSQENLRHQWGGHYRFPVDRKKREFDKLLAGARPLSELVAEISGKPDEAAKRREDKLKAGAAQGASIQKQERPAVRDGVSAAREERPDVPEASGSGFSSYDAPASWTSLDEDVRTEEKPAARPAAKRRPGVIRVKPSAVSNWTILKKRPSGPKTYAFGGKVTSSMMLARRRKPNSR